MLDYLRKCAALGHGRMNVSRKHLKLAVYQEWWSKHWHQSVVDHNSVIILLMNNTEYGAPKGKWWCEIEGKTIFQCFRMKTPDFMGGLRANAKFYWGNAVVLWENMKNLRVNTKALKKKKILQYIATKQPENTNHLAHLWGHKLLWQLDFPSLWTVK